MSTRIIVHKITLFFTFTLFAVFLVKSVSATQVRGIMIDPPSPIYNQQFNCAITLDQDDHRNACSLLPLNAPAGTFPWDVCKIDTVSADKLTRFYHCVASSEKKVPGPGTYQIVDWNFTGDGETGKVIYSRQITIGAPPPPKPTNPPLTPTQYVPPPPTDIPVTQVPPTEPKHVETKAMPATQRTPTIIEFSLTDQGAGNNMNETGVQKKSSPFTISLPLLPRVSPGVMREWTNQLLYGITQTADKTKRSVLQPFFAVISQFMKETNY